MAGAGEARKSQATCVRRSWAEVQAATATGGRPHVSHTANGTCATCSHAKGPAVVAAEPLRPAWSVRSALTKRLLFI